MDIRDSDGAVSVVCEEVVSGVEASEQARAEKSVEIKAV